MRDSRGSNACTRPVTLPTRRRPGRPRARDRPAGRAPRPRPPAPAHRRVDASQQIASAAPLTELGRITAAVAALPALPADGARYGSGPLTAAWLALMQSRHSRRAYFVPSGVRVPRMNSIMKRWIQSCRHELLDQTLICNQRHALHALREYQRHHNAHRPHLGISNARPLHPLPEPLTRPDHAPRHPPT